MTRRILVVDDEKQIRLLIQAAISATGVDVLIAADGEEAIRLARENSPLELVITDVIMPGIDGFALASALSAEGHSARFLFISGFFDGEASQKMLEGRGCAAFLEKPFSIPDLIRAVRSLLGQEARLQQGA